MLPRALLLLALLAFVLAASRADAAPQIALRIPTPGAPVELLPREGGYAADFVVANTGDAPLTVSRIAIRSDEDDPRAPSRLSVRFEGGGASATIAPGASKTATVRWMPERDPRMRQALGHVVVTSNDERAGEVAVGFRAELAEPLAFFTRHLLGWMIFLPLGGALLAL